MAFCLPEKVDQSSEVRRPLVDTLAFWKSEEVAMAVGTPEAPIVPRTELALMEARPMVAFVPPTSAPAPAESVRPLLPVRVVVATFANVFAPEKYGMLLMTAAVEVERPPNVICAVLVFHERGKAAEMEVVARVEKYDGEKFCHVPAQLPVLLRRGEDVAMTVPVPLTARKVPAVVAREERTGAVVNVWASDQVLAVVVPNAIPMVAGTLMYVRG